ncbi:hypothetical protein [Polaromonas aquatica]|uniref:Uncharacterized protein n=1 Tax=Polaromonas aquatica TaxID=332657 RepID=A0ABW1TWL1_9BURK
MKYKITPFSSSEKFSLELHDFTPEGGYELFLQRFCQFAEESFFDWFQGVQSGIGHITYLGTTLTVVWNDFPQSFSFDCSSEKLAVSLQSQLEQFLQN